MDEYFDNLMMDRTVLTITENLETVKYNSALLLDKNKMNCDCAEKKPRKSKY